MMDIEMKITGLKDIINIDEEFTLYKKANNISKENLITCVKAMYNSFLRDTRAIIQGALAINKDWINPDIVKKMKEAHEKK